MIVLGLCVMDTTHRILQKMNIIICVPKNSNRRVRVNSYGIYAGGGDNHKIVEQHHFSMSVALALKFQGRGRNYD